MVGNTVLFNKIPGIPKLRRTKGVRFLCEYCSSSSSCLNFKGSNNFRGRKDFLILFASNDNENKVITYFLNKS